MAITVDERLRFVERLVIDPIPAAVAEDLGREPLALTETAAEAYVDAGSIVSFVTGLTTRHKEDVVNSTLLASLVASHEHNRETQTIEWYDRYREVLENVGWDISAFAFDRFEESGTTFTVDKVVLEVLGAIATQSELAMAKAALEALRSLEEGSRAVKIWESNTHEAAHGNFQVSPAQEADGVVAMSLAAFYFHAKQTTTRFLWFGYSGSDIEIWKAAQAITLDEAIYGKVRETVLEKLGNAAQSFVAGLPRVG